MQSRTAIPVRDFWDVIRHVRDPRQVVLGMIPQSYRKKMVLTGLNTGRYFKETEAVSPGRVLDGAECQFLSSEKAILMTG
jgi:hypothetical protein